MSEILAPAPLLTAAEIEAELKQLATCQRAASGSAMRFLNRLGGGAETLLARLPRPVRNNLASATEAALWLAVRNTAQSDRYLPRPSAQVNRLIGAALGAAGGATGLPGTLAELPVTTAFLLRSIQSEAARQGFDVTSESVLFDTIQVFGASGPFADTGQTDTDFLMTRLSLTGTGLQKLIAQVAPKLGMVLGQKLAAQAVPVLGGAAGASANYIFTGYYQNMARVHFGVRRLATVCDQSEEALRLQLQDVLTAG
ncbi:EcsC protein family protein [Epibacterium ulvae]|uniref:EcsC protein family protein n=1 Tax=Epibacterium ulvae TaxID=1156985 RepID=A0A1G5R448_9RHOB|nr:EcsC family protein [Epibacterium ulvae]SCZ68736.1 EcsC protein family protein [Epibacterium ulvae]